MHIYRPVLPLCLIALALFATACNPSSTDGLAGSGVDTNLEVAPEDGDAAADESDAAAEDGAEDAMGAEEGMGADDQTSADAAAEAPAMGAAGASGMMAAGAPLDDPDIVAVNDPKAAARAASSGGSLAGDAATDAEGTMPLSDAEAQAMLAAHNRWRARYNVPPLTWDPELAAVAQAYADQLAAGTARGHSSSGYGENLAGSWPAGNTPRTDAVDGWGNEVQHYDLSCTQGHNACCAPGEDCGHFTQVVWSKTTRVGCGAAAGADRWDRIVCNYDPAGNLNDDNPIEGGAAAAAPAPTRESPPPTVEIPQPTEAPAEPPQAPVEPTEIPWDEPAPEPPAEGQTVYSSRSSEGDLGLAIPDEGTLRHDIQSTLPGTILDMAMGVSIAHSYIGDVGIGLYHPDGSYAILRSPSGGDADRIDDTYGKGGIPVSGLDAFRGKPLAGTWSLVIFDTAAEDTGTLEGTSLYFEYTE